jgi:aryl-alcohol dehydrogenase-like predicted oxidoreductase
LAERKTNYFGYADKSTGMSAWEDNIHNVLETLDGFVKGKSNISDFQMKILGESCVFWRKSKYNNLPRVKTIQNPYSLLTDFLNGSAEVCLRENVGLLAYSRWLLGFCLVNLTGETHPNAENRCFPQYSSIQQRTKY